ncbi:hypothetical protein SAMN04490207_0093 [Pseudomonas gessardii]|uniref:Uncharacterized protein n=2 Tax=Pseudomonas fluorescens group TaxID=136843 RepID=A0A7Y1QP64_9PSED|nr:MULTISPECIES: conjugative transfer protein MobI(A/C) [Pseudomonas]MCF5506505.1 hypothetical protein [Pseudomonas sp. PA-3-6H]MCF5515049.1 hypothetical protein [Pseudomonas sp. PA-3-6E]MCF5561756.1 hypothetical protein [Pseudomonas sp. PA-3-5D]MCF5565264.1 hypothetical protein [Pseudomonas sp. PA-3-11C]MCF5591583.1 hypothetical protein [Pseudomonas sp. PA-3-10C]
MNSPSEAPKHPAVAEIDRMYAVLVERAEDLREAFFKTALDLHAGKPGHIPIGINVKQSSPNAYSFNWVKIELIKGDGKNGSQKITTLDKGRGSNYPLNGFNFVKGSLNPIVRGYELQLREIRVAGSMLQKIRRSLIAAATRVASVEQRVAILAEDRR